MSSSHHNSQTTTVPPLPNAGAARPVPQTSTGLELSSLSPELRDRYPAAWRRYALRSLAYLVTFSALLVLILTFDRHGNRRHLQGWMTWVALACAALLFGLVVRDVVLRKRQPGAAFPWGLLLKSAERGPFYRQVANGTVSTDPVIRQIQTLWTRGVLSRGSNAVALVVNWLALGVLFSLGGSWYIAVVYLPVLAQNLFLAWGYTKAKKLAPQLRQANPV